MRFAYLLKKFPRLSETFILNEILAQEALGEPWNQTVPVYSRRAPDDEPRHPSLREHKGAVHVLPSTREIDPWSTLFKTSDASSSDQMLNALRGINQDLGPLVGPRLSTLIAEALYLFDRTLIDGVRHLHVHFATESAITALILARLGGPTFSLTAHAKDIYRETVSPELLDLIVCGSEFTVTVCDANVAHMRSMVSSKAARKIRRLYNGIDLNSFQSESEPKRTPHEILSVGRLVEKKGLDVLLDALALMSAEGLPFLARIVGEGDQRETLHARAAELGLGDQVLFTGPQDQLYVRDAMRKASVFALPCIVGEDGNRDALPTVLVEAIALGLPCVSTPVTGIPEILRTNDGPAGALVPERDARATADALTRLLLDPLERERCGANGRKHASVHFDRRIQGATLRKWLLESIGAGVAV